MFIRRFCKGGSSLCRRAKCPRLPPLKAFGHCPSPMQPLSAIAGLPHGEGSGRLTMPGTARRGSFQCRWVPFAGPLPPSRWYLTETGNVASKMAASLRVHTCPSDPCCPHRFPEISKSQRPLPPDSADLWTTNGPLPLSGVASIRPPGTPEAPFESEYEYHPLMLLRSRRRSSWS